MGDAPIAFRRGADWRVMGIDNNSDGKRAADEAVEWVILLREEPEDADLRARFEAWLAASPAHAQAWAATAHAYDRAGDVRPAFARPVRAAESRPVLPSGPRVFRPRRAEQMRSPRRMPRRRSVAAGAIAAGLALAATPTLLLHAQASYITGTGQLAQVRLPDGSQVRLAPRSAIAVTYAANRRQIRLLKGEAWFAVRHDASRPFYVEANGVTTTDVGTTFDVKRDAEGVTTAVSNGLVRVAYDAAPPVSELLSAGDAVHVAHNGALARTHGPVDQVAAWRNRQVIVENRPASEVIDALRPWYRGIILVRGGGFAHQRVTGVYNAADPIEALQGLVQAYGGSLRQVSPWVVILSN